MKIEVDDIKYEVLHQFTEHRALIRFGSAVVFADYEASPDGTDGEWVLSGQPASDEEKPILVALEGPMDVSELTITKDE